MRRRTDKEPVGQTQRRHGTGVPPPVCPHREAWSVWFVAPNAPRTETWGVTKAAQPGAASPLR